MGVGMAQQVAASSAEDAAVDARNAGKLRAHHRANKQYDVTANLDNVQYLNDVQEKDVQDDRVYQAMLDSMSDTDFQMKALFADYDHKIEDANKAMAKNDYAGGQTGATAARLAAEPVRQKGQEISRILHSKMRTQVEGSVKKERTWRKSVDKSWDLHMDVAHAPAHGFRPRDKGFERGRGKGLLMLELGGHALQGYSQLQANTAPPTTV